MNKYIPLAVVALASMVGAVACGSSSSTGSATTSSNSSSSGSTPAGAGATLKCTSSGKNAFDTYGATAFVTVNENIFKNVFAQLATDAGASGLGDSFGVIGKDGHDSAATFEGTLAAFLVYEYGGPTSITYTDGKTYQGAGQNLETEHAGLEITMDQYTYFVDNVIVPALSSAGVPTGDIDSCFAPLVLNSAVISAVVGH